MNELFKLVVFTLDNQKYALHLSAVETIIRAVEFTALPKTPKIVNGIINFHGKIIPLFNIRKRFNLPHKELEEITQNKGILYDPEVVDVCIKLFKEKEFNFY